MKNREINQVDQQGGSFVNSNLHLQGWEDLRTGNTVSGCHFLQEFSAEKTEINHGVENLAKYVITCGNWGHKWRRWKYLSLIVIISDRAMGCHYFLAYHIFMWVSIYSVLSGIVGLFERKKPPLSFSMIPTPSKHTDCLIVPPIHTNAQIAFTHNHIEWKKDQSFSPSTATGGEKTLLLLWIKNNNPNQQ